MRSSLSSVAQAKELARRRLPPSIFDYVEGGKEAEISVRANEEAFEQLRFRPRVCALSGAVNASTELLGRRIAMPVVIAPTGFVRVLHADGELGAARAAAAAGIPIALSTLCGVPAADVVATNPDTWFQLYMLGGRDGTREMIAAARSANCRVLVVTVDVAAITPRDRVVQALPMRIDAGTALRFMTQAWNRPAWLFSFLRGGLNMAVPNVPRNTDGSKLTLSQIGALLTATSPSWADIEWIRSEWSGPLVVKGVLRPDDARRAVEAGADAVCVSNHGAKTLDATTAPLQALPAISDAIGSDAEILLDGGVRRGADVVRACALGARAVLIGRPYLWGLAAGGERGVSDLLRVFQRGVEGTLGQLGCASVAELNTTYVTRSLD